MEAETAGKKRSRDEIEKDAEAPPSEPPAKKQKTDLNGSKKESTPPLVVVCRFRVNILRTKFNQFNINMSLFRMKKTKQSQINQRSIHQNLHCVQHHQQELNQ